MSHTTEVKSIGIKDINAVRQAVAELKRNGVNCDFLENETPRMYTHDQYFKSTGKQKADYVIKLHDSIYDLGLTAEYKTDAQGNKVFDSYSIQTDFYTGSVEKQLGFPQTEDCKGDAVRLGKFTQAYVKHAAKNQLESEGFSLQDHDITVDEKGAIHLSFVQLNF